MSDVGYIIVICFTVLFAVSEIVLPIFQKNIESGVNNGNTKD